MLLTAYRAQAAPHQNDLAHEGSGAGLGACISVCSHEGFSLGLQIHFFKGLSVSPHVYH